jgi:DNA-binding MarR family transcriptional regulator
VARVELVPLIAAASERQARLLAPRLEAIGLRETTFQFLLAVGEARGASLTELSRRLGLAPATLTEGIDDLVRLGLAERAPLPDDRRKATAAPTEAGLEVLGRIRLAVREAEAELCSPLDDEEQAALARLLEKLVSPSD